MKELFIALLITNLIAIVLIAVFIRRALLMLPKYITDEDNYLTQIAKQGGLLFLGDSLIQLYDTNAFFSGKLTHNRGVGGNTTSQIIERLPTSVYPVCPEQIILLAGTNDLNKQAEARTTFEGIAKVCALIKENLPNTDLYVISLLPVNAKVSKVSKAIVGKRRNSDIAEVNKHLSAFCTEQNIGFIDACPVLLDSQGNLNPQYSLDGLHINFKGYKVLTEQILACLQKKNEHIDKNQ